MFRKSKNNKQRPPDAPSLEEILADIECQGVSIDNKVLEDLMKPHGNPSLDAWWADFQQFRDNLKMATLISSEINAYIPKLEATKTKLGESAQQLQMDIEKQQQVIADLLENPN